MHHGLVNLCKYCETLHGYRADYFPDDVLDVQFIECLLRSAWQNSPCSFLAFTQTACVQQVLLHFRLVRQQCPSALSMTGIG